MWETTWAFLFWGGRPEQLREQAFENDQIFMGLVQGDDWHVTKHSTKKNICLLISGEARVQTRLQNHLKYSG